nr:hypothetical protein [Burkholderia mayonis]
MGITRLPLNNVADINMRVIVIERFIAVLLPPPSPRRGRNDPVGGSGGGRFHDFSAGQNPEPSHKISHGLRGSGVPSPDRAGSVANSERGQSRRRRHALGAAAGAGAQQSASGRVVYKALDNDTEHLELKFAVTWHADRISAGLQSMLSMLDVKLQ